MKKAIAHILMILCVGYAGGILLNTYTQENSAGPLAKGNSADYFFSDSAKLSDTSSDDNFCARKFIIIEALATSISKIKLPEASSGPVITATFTASLYPFFYHSTVTDPAQLHLQPTAIFLQNCVLRL